MKSTVVVMIALMFVPAAVLSQSTDGKNYVGYKYKGVTPESTLPNGVKHLGGGLMGDINANPVYGVSMVQRGKMKMLWLEASTGQDAGGVTGWLVKDVLAFPAMKSTDHIFFYGDPAIGCRRNGEDVQNLVGIGQIIRRQGSFKPSKLWIADLTTHKFKPIPVAGIKCEYSEP